MKCENLIKFLNALEEQLHGEKAISEINKIRNILDTHPNLSGRVEALCRSLSLGFALPPNHTLANLAHRVYAEAMSWSSDKEQILDTVDDWLECKDVSQVDHFLIQSSLLWANHDLQSAVQWAEEAQKLAISSRQSSRKSWADYLCVIVEYYRGIELEHQGRLKHAEAALKHAITVFPHLFVVWGNLGSVLTQQGRLSEALSALERAKELNPNSWSTYAGIGNIYCIQRQFKKGEDALRNGLTIAPNNRPLLNILGVVQMAQGKLICAISTFRHAASLHCDPIDGRHNLENEVKEAYHPKEIVEYIYRMYESGPWNNLGAALQSIGHCKEAIAAFYKEIEINPYNPLPWGNLISSYVQSNNLLKAADTLRRYLILQVRKAQVVPLRVARDFSSFTCNDSLARYELVTQVDSMNKLPGSGEHIVDNYLTIVQQSLIYGLERKELKPRDVIKNLIYIGILWSLYAKKLPQKEVGKQYAREQLYTIERNITDAFPHEAKAYGFNSMWPELKARVGTTSPEEFAHEMLKQESIWLQSVHEGQERGEVEDLRWRFQGNLWVHLHEYEQEQQIGHLERCHYYMELLKGHTVLHKLADPQIMRTAINIQKWNRYVNSLPVKVDRTAVIDLKACASSIPENGIGLSFYFLHRPLLPDLLLLITIYPDRTACVKTTEGTERFMKFQNAAELLKQVHHQVAWQEKVPAIGSVFCELSGEKEVLKGRELLKAIVEWEKKKLRQAYKAILEGVVDVEQLRGKDLYVSPSPEMYDIPFGLLLKEDEFLNQIVNSITIVPIFSLQQFQRKGYFPDKTGLVLCLDERWGGEAENRAESLCGRWCNGKPYQKIEHGLSRSASKGDINVKYNEWIEAMAEKSNVHIIGHHDASQWTHSTKQEPNLGQFGQYLYEISKKLSADFVSLETCWGGTWSEPEDLMGLFVSFLACGVSHIITSPYSVVPAATSGKLFDHIYRSPLETENGNICLQVASAIRNAAETVRQAIPNCDDTIPTLWGALQLYGTV